MFNIVYLILYTYIYMIYVFILYVIYTYIDIFTYIFWIYIHVRNLSAGPGFGISPGRRPGHKALLVGGSCSDSPSPCIYRILGPFILPGIYHFLKLEIVFCSVLELGWVGGCGWEWGCGCGCGCCGYFLFGSQKLVAFDPRAHHDVP